MPYSPQDWLRRHLPGSVDKPGFLWLCTFLSFAGTVTIAYPVTAVVAPAAYLAPQRWRRITLVTAFGSATGATLLMAAVHFLGWSLLYEYYPELASDGTWSRVMGWAEGHAVLALFVVAATPLPQTAALIFFGMSQPEFPTVFAAILAGKLLKYGMLAWLVSHFRAQINPLPPDYDRAG